MSSQGYHGSTGQKIITKNEEIGIQIKVIPPEVTPNE
jgi:hypothetical protein